MRIGFFVFWLAFGLVTGTHAQDKATPASSEEVKALQVQTTRLRAELLRMQKELNSQSRQSKQDREAFEKKAEELHEAEIRQQKLTQNKLDESKAAALQAAQAQKDEAVKNRRLIYGAGALTIIVGVILIWIGLRRPEKAVAVRVYSSAPRQELNELPINPPPLQLKKYAEVTEQMTGKPLNPVAFRLRLQNGTTVNCEALLFADREPVIEKIEGQRCQPIKWEHRFKRVEQTLSDSTTQR